MSGSFGDSTWADKLHLKMSENEIDGKSNYPYSLWLQDLYCEHARR